MVNEWKEEKTPQSKGRMEQGKAYLLSNWTAAKTRLLRQDGVEGSSTESHVSHILSARLGSRPMGWSQAGMAKMARLRAYYYNGGDMLELIRYQKQSRQEEEEKEVIYSSRKMLAEERRQKKALGEFSGVKIYSIPYNKIKKKVNFRDQICGL